MLRTEQWKELNVDCNKWHTNVYVVKKIENKCKSELEWAHAHTIITVLTCGLTFIEPVGGLTHKLNNILHLINNSPPSPLKSSIFSTFLLLLCVSVCVCMFTRSMLIKIGVSVTLAKLDLMPDSTFKLTLLKWLTIFDSIFFRSAVFLFSSRTYWLVKCLRGLAHTKDDFFPPKKYYAERLKSDHFYAVFP